MNSPAVPQARDRVTPAASIQERMWFAERMEPGTGLYNVPFAWRVRGTLSPEALQQALTLVIERHEILRTSFAEHDGRLRQLVAEPWTPVLERVDLRGTAADQELESWLRDFARRPFAMDGDRLLRVGLVELDGGRQVLALCAHHLVWDAASTPLFLRELRSCYETVGPGGFPAEDVPGDFDGLTESPTEAPAVLPVLFDRQANRLPGKTAVVFEDTALSYRDLDRRSSAVAAYLADRGIGRGDLVGVCLDRSADLVVALLGVLKSGAAYVPLDPIYPRDRISGMLEDAQVGLVLTQERLEPLAGSAIPVCLDRDWPRIEAAGYAEAAPVTGDDLAYVIYTSGSTGRPKGVRVTHHGLGNLLGSMAHRPGFGEHDTMLAVTTVCFDIAALELYLPLITGGTVEVAPNSVASDGEQLKRHLGRTRPSHLQATPATWRLLVAAGWTGDQWLTVFCGGEALSRELADELLDRSAAVWNLYGPTETTIWSTVSRVGRGGPVTIGRAIANTDLYLLDDALRPVPAGEVGELWIGGDGVADGYLRRPELTGERFRPSPFRPSPAMLYRTGDLVRELPDGRLLYVNRADNQIKLHGYRIEPGEIESCLRAHGSITEAAVLLENDRLAAYLQCAGPPPSPAELRARLGGTLPDYMIPSVFHAVDEFPLTDNGKLDRKAVRGLGTRLATGTGRAPSTPTARVVAAAFAQVLEVSEPDADDSFFELGGHSLLAARLVTELGARLGVRLSLRDLFEHPGVQDLADHLDTLAPQRQNPEESTEDAPGEPASSMQEQMWLAEQRHPDEPSYNVPLSWRVTGTLDAGALRTAFGTLIERHEILRTAFVEHAGRLRQVVRPGWLPEIEHTDLSAVAGHEAAIGALVDAEAGTAFDLGSGRPLRVRLVDRGADRLLMVCLHHMVFDAQSIPAFLRDLGNAYTRALGRPAPELPPVVQFGEVARWQREHLAGEDGQYSLDHWLDHLTAAPESLRLGAPPRQPEPHGAVRIPFGEDFAETSAPLQAEHRTSWFVIALAAVTAWLHRWSGSDDVTFGLPLGNRETEQAADVVGPCLNTVVLRARCKREMTFADLLTEMRESFLDALEHQAVPLPEVLERLAPRRHSGGSPYLDVGVNMVTNSGEATVFGDAVLTAVPFDRWQHETKFGLTVTFLDDGGKLGAVLSYRGDRHTAVEATELAHGLGALLDDVMAATSRALAQDSPSAQYSAFARAQVAERASTAHGEGVEKWARALDGAPAFLPLTPPLRSGPPGSVPIPLAPGALERLRSVQIEHGVSWFMVAATALAALLHRWTGQPDVTFGLPVANRDGFADVLGPCLNTVVVRSEHDEGATLTDLLRAMRGTVLDAFDHQRVPFEDVVDRLRPPRRPGWIPYADVTLAATSAANETAEVGGLDLSPIPLDHDGAGYAAKFALTVGFEESDGQLRGTILHRGDRFTGGEVQRMAGWLGKLVDSFADVADQPVRTLDLVGPGELAELTRFEQIAPAGAVTSAPAMFAQSVAATPGAPAIRHAHGVISYAELDQRAETMAAAIRTHVRGERPVVALLLPRGPELVVAMLAAWKAGCVFCPLDPVYPAARVRFILDDLEACAVVTDDPAALREANPGGVAVIDVAGIPAGHGSAPAALPDPESTAYVLYTSGTTGEPKGVAYSHRSLGHVTRWHIDTFGVGPADRISQIHSVAFDMAEYEIWPALCSGAELLPYEPPLVVPELVAWLGEQDVTMFFTPTPLAETLWADGTALPSLRWLIFAGSPLTGQPPATGYGICDAYGPTETYITTTHVLDRSTATALNCVGRPVDGVRLYVLDSAGNRCPIGIPGEIQVDGATVSQGYWRREDLTRQRFSALGPDGEPAWMYRTGDRGRWLPDGTVEYLGRLDRQLKVRGYRVEPQEIESQLRRDPLIRQAVVRTFPDDTAQLVAYLVAEDSAQADSSVVLARIKQQLPEFMVPDALVWLPELPMNSRGKLDTGRLPRPGRDDMAGRTAFQAPEAGLEQRIAGVWARVLGIGSVGAHDNFFDLGGNSLLLATLHSRLQEELSVSLPIRELFEYPTVQALAKALGSPLREEKSTAADAKDRASRSRARKARPTRSAKMGTSDE